MKGSTKQEATRVSSVALEKDENKAKAKCTLDRQVSFRERRSAGRRRGCETQVIAVPKKGPSKGQHGVRAHADASERGCVNVG
eukprot:IDg10538t1